MSLPTTSQLFPAGAIAPAAAKGYMQALLQALIDNLGDMSSKAGVQQVLGVGLRNKLHNGNFTVNERGVSGTVTLAAGAYGHDRWKAGSSGCTYTFATSGPDVVLTITAGTLVQVVDGAWIEAGTYAISHAGAAQVRAAVSGGTPSGSYTSASTASPLVTAAGTAGGHVTVEFSTGTVSQVQVERSGVATPFERRPLPLEQHLCGQYARAVTCSARGNAAAAGNRTGVSVPWPRMRGTPTATGVSTGSSFNLSTGAVLYPSNAVGGLFEVVAGSSGDYYSLDTRFLLSADL